MIDTPVSESDNDAIHSEAVDFNLLNQIKKQAQGRTIISILGNITPRKNLSLFLAAITPARPFKVFFSCAG